MWHRTGEYCPKGTIPILRSSAANIPPNNIYDRRRVFNNADQNSSNQIPHPEDFKTGTWWLNIDGWNIGYWPARLFTKLNRSAQKLQWGGRVVNTKPKGLHTTTQMGSGHFPREGQGKAAQFHNLEFIGENEFYSHAIDVEGYATRPECYEVKVQDWDKDLHTHFFYGGRGYSDACR
ncbi:hypothetical protein LINGRAHAP2_LOCUS12287 [Linum grandiflorum]